MHRFTVMTELNMTTFHLNTDSNNDLNDSDIHSCRKESISVTASSEIHQPASIYEARPQLKNIKHSVIIIQAQLNTHIKHMFRYTVYNIVNKRSCSYMNLILSVSFRCISVAVMFATVQYCLSSLLKFHFFFFFFFFVSLLIFTKQSG